MLCEVCHENEATVHLTQVVDGKVEKFHLCEACAAEKGIDVHTQPMDLSGMMKNIKEELEHIQTGGGEASSVRETVCPECGMTRKDILKKGRLGCARCYDRFAAEILPVIMSLQHSDQHMGKVPRRASASLKASVERTRLRRELDQAVAGENYERAAELRDLIRALPEEEGGA